MSSEFTRDQESRDATATLYLEGGNINDEHDGPADIKIVDINAYAHKKTLAQGMMDLALLTANANQLHYVLGNLRHDPYTYASLIFLILSISFQIAVGVGLILNSRYDIRDKRQVCHAEKVGNYTICGVFIITVINVFITAFGIPTTTEGSNQNTVANGN